jgi:hypothetical protein
MDFLSKINLTTDTQRAQRKCNKEMKCKKLYLKICEVLENLITMRGVATRLFRIFSLGVSILLF